jgi:hypothetical protein
MKTSVYGFKILIAGSDGTAPVGGLQCQTCIVVESPTNKNPQPGLGPSPGAGPSRYSSTWRQRWSKGRGRGEPRRVEARRSLHLRVAA